MRGVMAETETAETQQDPEGARVESLDARFGAIEHEQAEQRGILTQIRDALAGKGKTAPAHAAAQEHTETRLEASSSIADQVRRAVQDVNAEEEQRKRDEAHAADHAALAEAREKPPREAASGVRGRIQRAMFGAEPK